MSQVWMNGGGRFRFESGDLESSGSTPLHGPSGRFGHLSEVASSVWTSFSFRAPRPETTHQLRMFRAAMRSAEGTAFEGKIVPFVDDEMTLASKLCDANVKPGRINFVEILTKARSGVPHLSRNRGVAPDLFLSAYSARVRSLGSDLLPSSMIVDQSMSNEPFADFLPNPTQVKFKAFPIPDASVSIYRAVAVVTRSGADLNVIEVAPLAVMGLKIPDRLAARISSFSSLPTNSIIERYFARARPPIWRPQSNEVSVGDFNLKLYSIEGMGIRAALNRELPEFRFSEHYRPQQP